MDDAFTVTATTGAPFDQVPVRGGLLETFEAAWGADLIGCTIMRIRGHVGVVVPATGTMHIRVGIKINDNRTPPDVLENLFNASVVGGAHDDWMAWYPLVSGPAAAALSDRLTAKEVDVRSMRKLDELGQRLEIYASGFSLLDPSPSAVIAYDLSILLALP